MPHGQPHTPPGLLQRDPLDDPNYDYGTILPFRMRNTLDVDELDTDVTPELAVPGLLRDVGNSAVRMGQMMKGSRPVGLIIDDVMDFSPAGLLGRMPSGALGMNVFQGGPNKYGPGGAADSLQHIRRGEGALTYGYGRYDAGEKAVAQEYRRQLAKGKASVFLDGKLVREYDDKTLNDPRSVGISMIESMQRLRPGSHTVGVDLSQDEVIDAALRQLKEFIKYDPDNAAGWRSGLKWIEHNRGRITSEPPGYLYKHDLPDDAVARYLDYDAPLSEQPQSVQKALKKLGFEVDPAEIRKYDKALLDALDGDAITPLPKRPKDPTGEEIHTELVTKFRFGGYGDGKEQAAKELGRAGIPGLRYLDLQSRGKVGIANDVRVMQHPDGTFEVRAYDSDSGQKFGEYFDFSADDVVRLLGDEVGQKAVQQASSNPQRMQYLTDSVRMGDDATRNYVTWDEEVLKRMKLLQRNDQTFKAVPGVPVMGLIQQPGGLDIMGQYTGGVI